MNDIFNFEFCGLPVSSFTREQLITYIKDSIFFKKNVVAYGHSLGIFPLMYSEPDTAKYIKNYQLYVSDGDKFHRLGKYLGLPFKYRISLPELTYLSLEIANSLGASVFLLGATEDINKLACKKIIENYKNIKRCEGLNGYFSEDQESAIIEKINNFQPDVLFLGMSSPKKEIFINRNLNKLKTGISILNGGMIDVLAEKVMLTPPIIKKFGLALFFRFIQNPKSKITQFLTFHPLIIFYFVPIIIYNYKIKKNFDFSFNDFRIIKHKLHK